MSSICAPALVYLIFSILAILYMVYDHYSAGSVLVKVIFIAIWTWFLNILCEKGFEPLSWFLVLLPFILFILFILIILHNIKKIKDKRVY
jgi:hypothetical protein